MEGYVSKPVRPEVPRRGIELTTRGASSPNSPQTPVSHERPGQSEWDLKQLMERLDGDHEFLRELLVIFQQDAQANTDKARAALASGDFAALTRAAHTLKGMLKNLAMGAAAQTASDLEQASRKELHAESEQGLQQLNKELAALFPEVEAQLSEVKS